MSSIRSLYFLLSLASCRPVPLPDLLHLSENAGSRFLWSSIAVAVATAFLQGLVTALAFMTEEANQWTFRFRIARIEHWWWSLVSLFLLTSLVLIILSFLTGNSSDTISILALSTATTLAVVQYMLPSWRSRHYINNRWLAWTGDSRTAVDRTLAPYCGDAKNWLNIKKNVKRERIHKSASDWYGWHFGTARGLPEDPTDILRNIKSEDPKYDKFLAPLIPENYGLPAQVYDDGESPTSKNVSLRWGRSQLFRRRVSRAIRSLPNRLLTSHPKTNDGYAGEGLCLAMGILGRNKGLKPDLLVYHAENVPRGYLENRSAWEPRPCKVLRSCYAEAMKIEYGGLGPMFVAAATELSLILADCPPAALCAWLESGLDQQSISLNILLRATEGIQPEELNALYRSSYVSMIISLNNMKNRKAGLASEKNAILSRPDLVCLGLLLKAEGKKKPAWWDHEDVKRWRKQECDNLAWGWEDAAGWLLGLTGSPPASEAFLKGQWDPPTSITRPIQRNQMTSNDNPTMYYPSDRYNEKLEGETGKSPTLAAQDVVQPSLCTSTYDVNENKVVNETDVGCGQQELLLPDPNSIMSQMASSQSTLGSRSDCMPNL